MSRRPTDAEPRQPFVIPLLVAAVLAACSGPEDGPETDLPHVLLIVIEGARADHFSTNGYERDTTPTLNWIAERGTVFTRAASQSSATLPSLVSLFTGRRLASECARIPAGASTLAELLGRAGYRTGAFVDNPLLGGLGGFDRGFEQFSTQAGTKDLQSWLRRQEPGPVFTYVHLSDPRPPYAPKVAAHHFVKQGGGLDLTQRRYCEMLSQREGLVDLAGAVSRIERGIDGYDDDLRLADARLPAIITTLRKTGAWANTVVVVASTHGQALWEHPRDPTCLEKRAAEGPLAVDEYLQSGQGGLLYQELVHVPLVLRVPGRRPAARVDDPVENADILPTLLSLTGLEPPPDLDGQSLRNYLWKAEENPEPGPAVSVTRLAEAIQVPAGWKLIRPTADGAEAGLEVELYDLNDDPAERSNLAAEHPEVVLALGDDLDRMLSKGLQPRAAGAAALARD